MSGRLTRYLVRTMALHVALVATALAGVVLAVDGLERAGLLLAHHAAAADVATYLLLRLGTVAHLLLPVAGALGAALAVATLRHRGEWDAMRALGAGPLQLGAPLALAGAGLVGVLVLHEGWGLPRAIEGASRVESTRILGGSARLGAGAGPRWWRLDGGVLLAQEVSPAGDRLHGVTWLREGDDGHVDRRVEAAMLTHTARGWIASEGQSWRFPAGGELRRATVDAELLALEGLTPGGIRRRLLPLAQHDLPMLWSDPDPGARFTRNARLAHPLSAGLLLLLAAALTTRVRRGRARAAGVALALALAVTVLDGLAGALAPALGWPAPLPWAVPAGLIAALYFTTKEEASSRNQRVVQSA